MSVAFLLDLDHQDMCSIENIILEHLTAIERKAIGNGS
jgi:hypothetical protein